MHLQCSHEELHRTTWIAQAQQGIRSERVAGRGVGFVSFMHARSGILIDSPISTMSGRSTSGFHQQERDVRLIPFTRFAVILSMVR